MCKQRSIKAVPKSETRGAAGRRQGKTYSGSRNDPRKGKKELGFWGAGTGGKKNGGKHSPAGGEKRERETELGIAILGKGKKTDCSPKKSKPKGLSILLKNDKTPGICSKKQKRETPSEHGRREKRIRVGGNREGTAGTKP